MSSSTLRRLPFAELTAALSFKDILRLIEQYLSEEGFLATKLVLHDEANLKAKERGDRQAQSKSLKRAILGAVPARVSESIHADHYPYRRRMG